MTVTDPRGNPHQYTQEWWLARRGKLSSSRMDTIMNGGTRGWASLAKKLRAEEMVEEPQLIDLDHVRAIQHGRHFEPIARAEAEVALEEEFELVGFQTHAQNPWLGCSSDALTAGRKQNVEIKCPLNLERHLRIYQTRRVPDEHQPQVQCQMAVWELGETLFVSYHPDAPHWSMRCCIVVLPRDELYIAKMMRRVDAFREFYDKGLIPEHGARGAVPRLF